MPTPTIPDGSKQMYINLYTGTSGSQTLTNNSPSNPSGFQSGMQWFKSRSTATSQIAHDVLRGTAGVNRLLPNSTVAESTNGDGFVSINSNGFSLDGGGGGGDVNTSGRTYVAWQWAAPATGTSNTSGSITSSVSANTTSGFSVVTFTGGSGNQTVGHGLGVAPSMVVLKRRDSTSAWLTYHSALSNPATSFLSLNKTDSVTSATPFWGASGMTSTTIGTSDNATINGATYVAYCWASIAGYSAFGSYIGNGSADGPFVYTGFQPRWLMIKVTNVTDNWYVIDTARQTYNVIGNTLCPNLSNAEFSLTIADVLSNGFKIRNTGSNLNGSGNTVIYAAFASNPFKYANAF